MAPFTLEAQTGAPCDPMGNPAWLSPGPGEAETKAVLSPDKEAVGTTHLLPGEHTVPRELGSTEGNWVQLMNAPNPSISVNLPRPLLNTPVST